MKKVLSVLLSILMLASAMPFSATVAFADDLTSGSCGDNATYIFDPDTGTLTISGTGAMTDYYSDSPFQNNNSIKSVIIENGITSVGDYAFYDCSSLKSITIPDSVTNIGKVAFSNCRGLTSVTIPDSIESIEDGVFSGCKSLTDVSLSNNVTSIGGFVFEDCTALTNINLPNSLTEIPFSLFSGCTSLTSISLPNGLTSIGSLAFSGCSSLESITIPDNVTDIHNDAFYNCSALATFSVSNGNQNYCSVDGVLFNKEKTELLNYPANNNRTTYSVPIGVTSIGYSAFSGCNYLTSITIPNSVTSIVYSAFKDCKSLISISIPESITRIDNYAFEGCTGLTSITIPDSVTSIGVAAFSGCECLTSITIPDGVTTVYDGVFVGCTNLRELTMPCSIEIIRGSFTGCNNLTKVTLTKGNGVMPKYANTNIGGKPYYDFLPWNSLESVNKVVIEEGVTNISDNTFVSAKSLKSITIPNSVKSIGDYAFFMCDKLDEVHYGGTIAQWNNIEMGYSNGYLTNAVIYCTDGIINEPVSEDTVVVDGVTYSKDMTVLIDYPADKTDKEFVIPSSVKVISPNSFKSASLEKLVISKNVESIGTDAFSACQNLSDITIENGTKLITLNSSFANLPIKSISLGTGIKTIGEGAFENTKLESVELPETVVTVSKKAFAGCNSLKTVSINEGVKEISEDAFDDTSSSIEFHVVYGSYAEGYAKKKNYTYISLGIDLKAQYYAYTGKAIKPDYSVKAYKNGKEFTLAANNYTVSLSNSTNTGTATIIVKGRNEYEGITVKDHYYIVKLNATVSKTSYVYDGKGKHPSVTVKNSKGQKIGTSNYSVPSTKYSKIGKYKYAVKLKGNYRGTITTNEFTIKPKGSKVKSLKKGKKSFTVKWKKRTNQVDGYQIQVSTDKKFKKIVKTDTIKGAKKTNHLVKNLKSKKRYYVRVQTFKKVGNTFYFSGWSKAKSVKTK